jgi:Rrf2 family iron-sulfur cluster assembly transcriptional regulator
MLRPSRESLGWVMPLLPHKTVIAIGAVVDIALHSIDGPVSARDVADRLGLPPRYLEPTFQALVREGILRGLRGVAGGYMLAKARQAISLHDISEVVRTMETEEPSEELAWLLRTVVTPTLLQAEEHFESTLKRITVEDLARAAGLQTLASYKPDAIAG